MLKLLLLAFFLTMFVTLTTMQITKAYFTDQATSNNNTFTAASEFPPLTSPEITATTTPTPTSLSLIINEVSPQGGNNDDWIEIYNPTSSPINLTGWKIRDNSASDELIPNSNPIPAGSYAVIIATNSAVVSIPGSAIKIVLSSSAIGNGLAAGGDRVILKNPTDTIIDSMSFGSDTTILNLPAPTSIQTIRRIPNATDTNTAADWQAGISSIGISN